MSRAYSYNAQEIFSLQYCNCSILHEMHAYVFQSAALESGYFVNPLIMGRRLSDSNTASVSLACVIMATEKDKRNLGEYMKFSKSVCSNE